MNVVVDRSRLKVLKSVTWEEGHDLLADLPFPAVLK